MQPTVCQIAQEADIYLALWRVRELSQKLGFSTVDRTRIEIALLELTRNLINHAGGGTLTIEQLASPERGAGISLEALDAGPGIADINLALKDGYSTARSLGMGLPGIRRLMDEFMIESTVGVGTRVRAIKWRIVSQRRAIYGR